MQQLSEVVKYVLYRCRENNTPLTQIMTSFVVQTIFNSRTDKFYLEEKLSESEMRELKEAAIKKILSKDSLQMKIIDLQITYDTSFLEAEIRKETEVQREVMASGEHIDAVVKFAVKNAKDFQGLTQLYKKIFNYLLFKNKQLTPKTAFEANQFKIQKEVAAALQSVIPRAALGPFVTLNQSEKVTQLVELSNLVLGIRLFNQQISKGGAGLEGIAELLKIQSVVILKEAFKELEDVTELCEKYANVFKVEQKGRLNFQPNQFRRLKNELTFIRHYRAFLIALEEEIQTSVGVFEANQEKYAHEMKDLQNLLGAKSSAPKEQVYPRFAILAQAYVNVYEERKYAPDKIKLYYILKEFRKCFPLSLSQKFFEKVALELKEIPLQNAEAVEEDPNSEVEIFMPSTSPDFMQKTCDYLGFCVWSIVKKNGLLLSGEPELGVYKYKDKTCLFSSIEAITDFLKEPEMYLKGVLDECRKNPELIHFLRLEDSFKRVKLSLASQAVEGGGIKNKLMVDKSIETPLHFIEKNIDPSYCWNQWELRKKAIQMANIRKTKTRADQTLLSNFRVDSDTQTFLKVEAGTNTVKNAGTQFKVQKMVQQGKKDPKQFHSVGV